MSSHPRLFAVTLAGLLLLGIGCRDVGSSATSVAPPPPAPSTPATPFVTQATPTPVPSDDPVSVGEGMVRVDQLTHAGYEVQRLEKQVRVPEADRPVTVSYVVLKRQGKTVASFDGMYSGVGNGAAFGLFPLLGGDSKQLVVSLDIPRGGRQWIVDLGPAPRVLFDGEWYGVGREIDDLSIIDIDRDGRSEILAPVTAFYMAIEKLYVYETPLPSVIFAYDEKAGKYVPANPRFEGFALRDARDRRQVLTSDAGVRDLAGHLDVLLDYLYAGRDVEAWDFFRNHYKGEDRAEVERKVRSVLKAQPAYKLIHARVTSQRS